MYFLVLVFIIIIHNYHVCSRLGKESGSKEGNFSFLGGLAKLKKPKTSRFGIFRFVNVSSSLIPYFGFWHDLISNQEYV